MQKERVTNLIQAAIESLRRHLQGLEIDNSLCSIPEGQILQFEKKLLEMVERLEEGEKSNWSPGLGRAITDGWPFDSSVGEAILEAEQAFKRFQNLK